MEKRLPEECQSLPAAVFQMLRKHTEIMLKLYLILQLHLIWLIIKYRKNDQIRGDGGCLCIRGKACFFG